MSSFSYTESALCNAPEKGKIKRVEKIINSVSKYTMGREKE